MCAIATTSAVSVAIRHQLTKRGSGGNGADVDGDWDGDGDGDGNVNSEDNDANADYGAAMTAKGTRTTRPGSASRVRTATSPVASASPPCSSGIRKEHVSLCKMSPASHFFFCEKAKKNLFPVVVKNFQSRLSQVKNIQKAGQSYHIRFSRVYHTHCTHRICHMQCMDIAFVHAMYATLHLSHATNATSDTLHTSHARTLLQVSY
jgi:hypothetical protein